MPKPPLLPIWADDATFTSGPSAGLPTKINQGGYLQGNVPGSSFVAEYPNFYINNLAKWNEYLNGIEGEPHVWTAAQTFTAGVTFNGGLSASGNLTINATTASGEDALQVGGLTTVSGLTTCTNGPVVFNSGLTVNGSVAMGTGGLNLSGARLVTNSNVTCRSASLLGPLTVTGNVSTSAGLLATNGITVSAGGYTATNDLTVSAGNFSCTGNLTTVGRISANDITANSGGIQVNGGGATVTGNSNISGTLTTSNTFTSGAFSISTGNVTAASLSTQDLVTTAGSGLNVVTASATNAVNTGTANVQSGFARGIVYSYPSNQTYDTQLKIATFNPINVGNQWTFDSPNNYLNVMAASQVASLDFITPPGTSLVFVAVDGTGAVGAGFTAEFFVYSTAEPPAPVVSQPITFNSGARQLQGFTIGVGASSSNRFLVKITSLAGTSPILSSQVHRVVVRLNYSGPLTTPGSM